MNKDDDNNTGLKSFINSMGGNYQEFKEDTNFTRNCIFVFIILALVIYYKTNLSNIENFWTYYCFTIVIFFALVDYIKKRKSLNIFNTNKDIFNNDFNKNLLKNIFEQIFKNKKRFWYLVPFFPIAWIIYKADFSDDKRERSLYRAIEGLIIFIICYFFIK